MEQGHALALPTVWAQALLFLYYFLRSHPAGDVWCGSSNAQPSYFSRDSIFYMGLATIWKGDVRKNEVLQEVVWVI